MPGTGVRVPAPATAGTRRDGFSALLHLVTPLAPLLGASSCRGGLAEGAGLWALAVPLLLLEMLGDWRKNGPRTSVPSPRSHVPPKEYGLGGRGVTMSVCLYFYPFLSLARLSLGCEVC